MLFYVVQKFEWKKGAAVKKTDPPNFWGSFLFLSLQLLFFLKEKNVNFALEIFNQIYLNKKF